MDLIMSKSFRDFKKTLVSFNDEHTDKQKIIGEFRGFS
jgi:hypothetical protein